MLKIASVFVGGRSFTPHDSSQLRFCDGLFGGFGPKVIKTATALFIYNFSPCL